MRRRPPPGNVIRSPSGKTRFKFEFFSGKDGSIVQAGKWPVRIQALLFEQDPTVRCYRSYPLTITYKNAKGIEKQHVPDFEVQRVDGSIEIHDMTSIKQRKSEEFRERAIERFCQNKGWVYVVHTELSLPDATTATNLYTLLGYASYAYCEDQIRKTVLEDMELDKKVKIHAIATQLAKDLGVLPGTVVGTVCWMIWNHELNTNLTKLLFVNGEVNKDAVIWRTGDQNEQATI
jgi:hypothetical protein